MLNKNQNDNNNNNKNVQKQNIKNNNFNKLRPIPRANRTIPIFRRRINNRRFIRSQNVIKVNKPKNVIQRNFNQNNKNSVIRGKDLLVPTDNDLVVQNSGIYAIVPINPLYWQGTRAKNMALQFQYYNPINISIEYVPTVSKFQKGTITIGCISNQIVNFASIQNTLISSTSGESFSCSEFFRKQIALNSLLQQKKLLLSADISKESVPFYIVIHLSGVTEENRLIAPGSFYINYNIKFFNPIAETLVYKTENSKQLNEFDRTQQNITAILLDQNGKYGVGTIINVEKIDNDYVYKYNGSEINLVEDKKATFFYSSVPGQEIIVKDIVDLTTFTYAEQDVSIDLLQYNELIAIDTTVQAFAIYQSNLSDPLRVTIMSGWYYFFNEEGSVVEKLQNAAVEITSIADVRYTYVTGFFKNVRFIGEHRVFINDTNLNHKFQQAQLITINDDKLSDFKIIKKKI